ncbi:MAG: sigma-70 family RNA polymerase sigma factor [bacterium]|nr:sigma-70 family RNA polymerase sigma factor [bacterium]
MPDAHATLTRILHGSAYRSEAVEEVLPLVYDELRKVAAVTLRKERAGHSMVATELVHEAYLRLFGGEQPRYTDRRHFFATAAIAMRRLLVEHARRKQAGKRIPEQAVVPLDKAPEPAEVVDVDVLALDEALTALAEFEPRMAQVVELRYFGGLTESEVAEVLEVSRPTVSRDWQAARLWLRRKMGP